MTGKNMKIAFIQDFFPDEQHGIYTHTHYLSRKLRLDPHVFVDIITSESAKSEPSRQRSVFTYLGSSILSDAINIISEINKNEYDIIHIHGTHLPLALIPLIKRKRFKVIVTLHGIVAIDSKHSIKNRLLLKNVVFGYFERLAINKADAVIAVSAAIEDIAQNKGVKKERIYTIPNGIDLEEFDRTHSTLKLGSPSLLFVGRLVKAKNVKTLIRSVVLVKEEIPDIHLYIAGDGPQMSKLRILVEELGLEKNITFLGYIFGDEKNQYYRSIDICIVPSTFESFSLVALEAMAAGKPVIASNVGGLPGLVEDGVTGYLFSPDDPRELADKIKQLIKNEPLQRKMGKSGREKAEHFNWSNIAKETISTYEKVIAGLR
jgi:glycosyltransferase involved in cell wall biosynthesis